MGWWYVDADQRRGPYSDSEFSILVENGTVRPSTLVWQDGLPEWSRYEELTFAGKGVDGGGRRFAGFWIRYVGKYLDNFFITFGALFVSLLFWVASGRPFNDEEQIVTALITLTIASVLVSGLYNVGFVGAVGKTPGKMFLKLEIVRADGSPVGYGLALVRWVAAVLNYLTLMIGWMMAGWSFEKQGLHDRICGTRVLDHGSRVGGPAGFWIRYVAKSLDGTLLSIPSTTLGMIMGVIFVATNSQEALQVGQMIGNLLGIVISFAYYTYFVGAYGATPGKMILGLKVIASDRTNVSYGRSAGRWFAAALNYVTLGIGWLIAAFDKEKRGLHDLICDTRVIHTR